MSIRLALVAALAVHAEPKRIVSTAPSTTEILFALGAGQKVVGVSSYCHYPPEAAARPKVGSYLRPNLEAIAALQPDLVISGRTGSDLSSKLGCPVVEADPHGIEGIYASIAEISGAIGIPEEGKRLTADIQNQLDEVRRHAAKLPRRRVVFIVGRTPNRIEGLVAVGRDSYLGQVLAIAGGDNVFADAPVAYPRVPLEEMLGRNPDVIIDMGDMAQTVGVTEQHKQMIVNLWDQYQTLKAVREHRVYAVASDVFVVPGPRVVDAAREFFRLIHPEAKR